MALQHGGCCQHLMQWASLATARASLCESCCIYFGNCHKLPASWQWNCCLGRHPRGPGAGGTLPWFLLWLGRNPTYAGGCSFTESNISWWILSPVASSQGLSLRQPVKLVHLIINYPYLGPQWCLWTDDIQGWRFLLSRSCLGGGSSPALVNTLIFLFPPMGHCMEKDPIEDEWAVKSAMSPSLVLI